MAVQWSEWLQTRDNISTLIWFYWLGTVFFSINCVTRAQKHVLDFLLGSPFNWQRAWKVPFRMKREGLNVVPNASERLSKNYSLWVQDFGHWSPGKRSFPGFKNEMIAVKITSCAKFVKRETPCRQLKNFWTQLIFFLQWNSLVLFTNTGGSCFVRISSIRNWTFSEVFLPDDFFKLCSFSNSAAFLLWRWHFFEVWEEL